MKERLEFLIKTNKLKEMPRTGWVLMGERNPEMIAEHTFRVLTVPKDIDALLSAGLGVTKLAFASKNAFDELKGINPGLCRKMKVVAEGDKTLLLIVALPQGFTANRKKTVDMIKNMSLNPDGKKRIRMLGLDGWQELDASDRSRLES